MGKFILKNVRIFAGGTDLTGVNNQIQLQAEAESKDSTAFATTGDVWHEELAGIKSSSLTASGQWEAGDLSKVDDALWAAQAAVGGFSVMPATAATGALAWLAKLDQTHYQLFGGVGDVAPWSLTGQGAWPLVRGQVLLQPTTLTGSSYTGTAVQIAGGVPAGQSLYAAVHVFSVSGSSTPTFSPLIQSDDNSGMTTPTHRITFSDFTAISGQCLRAAGPITDDYFQVYADLNGTSPSFLVAITIGVG